MMQFIDALLGLYADSGQGIGETNAHHGQGLVEYALVLAFIALVVIVALIYFGSRLTTLYSKLANSIPT